MCQNSPLFPGENDIEQLCCVFRVLGTPNNSIWPGLEELPDYNKITFAHFEAIDLSLVTPDARPESLDLLRKFLVYSPGQRITAADALLHPYFFSEPLPAHHSELPIPTRPQHLATSSKDRFNSALVLDSFLLPPAKLDLFESVLVSWKSWDIGTQCQCYTVNSKKIWPISIPGYALWPILDLHLESRRDPAYCMLLITPSFRHNPSNDTDDRILCFS